MVFRTKKTRKLGLQVSQKVGASSDTQHPTRVKPRWALAPAPGPNSYPASTCRQIILSTCIMTLQQYLMIQTLQ